MTTETDAYEAAFPPKSWTPFGDILDAHTARIIEGRVSDSPVSGTADERCPCGRYEQTVMHEDGEPRIVTRPVETVTGESTADERSPFRKAVDDLTGGDGCACHTGTGYNTSCVHCMPVSPPLQEGGGWTRSGQSRHAGRFGLRERFGIWDNVHTLERAYVPLAVEEAIRAEAEAGIQPTVTLYSMLSSRLQEERDKYQAALEEIRGLHVHDGACFGNYNTPTEPSCGMVEATATAAYIARRATQDDREEGR